MNNYMLPIHRIIASNAPYCTHNHDLSFKNFAVRKRMHTFAKNIKKMETKARHNMMMRAITDKAKSIVPPNSKVVLFGSRARGDAREDSDWDVLILLDKERITSQDIDMYTYPLRELGWDHNECINTVLYTLKDWHLRSASPFVENVTEEGVQLWG